MRAARYLRVAPWTLLDAPAAWVAWALLAERAENEAAEELQKQQAEG